MDGIGGEGSVERGFRGFRDFDNETSPVAIWDFTEWFLSRRDCLSVENQMHTKNRVP
jgi:hypothetical protein